jgi:catechol 2,3-dioxygenase-like lactoylglutathione lyase family enzyme
MLDHLGISVRDYAASKGFYEKALAPLGYSILMELPTPDGKHAAGFGTPGKPDFWIGDSGSSSGRVHVAFACPDHQSVDAFYRAAIEAGGKDNGAPGLRPHYHPNYYGPFVLDPDGNNVEAVCHTPR